MGLFEETTLATDSCACGANFSGSGDPFAVRRAHQVFVDAHKVCRERVEVVRDEAEYALQDPEAYAEEETFVKDPSTGDLVEVVGRGILCIHEKPLTCVVCDLGIFTDQVYSRLADGTVLCHECMP